MSAPRPPPSRAASIAGSQAASERGEGGKKGSERPSRAASEVSLAETEVGEAAANGERGASRAVSEIGPSRTASERGGNTSRAASERGGNASRAVSERGGNTSRAPSKAPSHAASKASDKGKASAEEDQPVADAGGGQTKAATTGKAKGYFKGVARGTQDAGLGSTHFNVAAPRHLSGLRPGNQCDPVLLSRLSAPSHVPAWVSNKEKAEALYSLALCEESKRLVEKDANDERVKTQQEWKDNIKALKRLWREGQEKFQERMKKWRNETTKQLQELGGKTAGLAQASGSFLQASKSSKLDFGGSFNSASGRHAKEDGSFRVIQPLPALQMWAEKMGLGGSMAEGGASFKGSFKGALPQQQQQLLPGDRQARIAVERLDEEEVSPDVSPPGVCAGCGEEEYVCAHCDFVRCSSCELHMHCLPSLGALVCDRCYVFYAATQEQEGRPKKWTPPPPSGPAALSLLLQNALNFSVLKAVAGLVPPQLQDTEEEEQEEDLQGAAWPGRGSLQSLGPQQAAMLDKGMERLKQGKEEVKDKDTKEPEVAPAGVCVKCSSVEYLCAHCDTILCPYCEMENELARPIGAILCSRCYVVWEKTRAPPEAHAPHAFPAPLETIGANSANPASNALTAKRGRVKNAKGTAGEEETGSVRSGASSKASSKAMPVNATPALAKASRAVEQTTGSGSASAKAALQSAGSGEANSNAGSERGSVKSHSSRTNARGGQFV